MTERTVPSGSRLFDRLAYGLFWSWNVIFLAFMLLGFAPQLLPEMVTAVRAGMIPLRYLFYALLLTCVPLAVVILGLTALCRRPAALFALGYVIEGPLMLMLGFRMFIVRDATLAVNSLLVVAGLGMAAFLWHLLDGRKEEDGTRMNAEAADLGEERSQLVAEPGDLAVSGQPAVSRGLRTVWGRRADWLRLAGMTLMLAASFYAAAWVAFYALPVSVEMARLLGEMLKNLPDVLSGLFENLLWLPFMLLGFLLLIYTATLFVLTPLAVPVLVSRAWWSRLRVLVGRSGWPVPSALCSAVLILCAALFFFTNQQPQRRAFALLSQSPASTGEAQALLEQQETIRAGLLNAYLAPFRYVSAVGEVNHVSQMYEYTLKTSPETARVIQSLYEGLLRPLLYEPVQPVQPGTTVVNQSLRDEPVQAAALYEHFFDQPIQQGERRQVVRAVSSTWSFDQAQIALQAVDEREVHLERQEITVDEQGDWAEVELYEVYRNQTGQRQEVVYYFSLPETAVVTGLWLGESADRSQRDKYRVAPRGAAQALYQSEASRKVDPALVEQIGPRQYRLRAFPVLPQGLDWDESRDRSTVSPAPPLHLWLTYRALAAGNAWLLPQLGEKRNVYWDARTERLVNGRAVKAPPDEAWLPAWLPAAAPVTPVAHRVDFPSGESVVARPVSAAELPVLPGGLRLAVVLDRSRSMAASAGLVEAALSRLETLSLDGTQVEVYLTASPYRGEEPSRAGLSEVASSSLMYFGGQNAAELLAQYARLNPGESYDAVLVLTDGSGYELGSASIDFPLPAAPTWLVHLGGQYPAGYDDATLEALQSSGGGVAGSLDEALTRLAISLQPGTGSALDAIDGYAWSALPARSDLSGLPPTDPAFAPLAARRLILAEMQRRRGDLSDPAILDTLHAIAIENSVVTPYSSMIVLVDARQQQELNRLEKGADRYEREIEPVGETLPPSNPLVTGVPEPEEWLLMGVAAAVLGWLWWKSRGKMAAGATGRLA